MNPLPLVLFPHQGLGDQFICHGIVRTIVDTRPCLLLCRREYVPTVAWMYRDHPAIGVIAIEDDQDGYNKCRSFAQHGLEIKMLGYLGGDPTFSDVNYDQLFYRQAGVPFEHRWSRFTFAPEPIASRLAPPAAPFIVVHDDYRFQIERNRLPETWPSPLYDDEFGDQHEYQEIRLSVATIDRSYPNLFSWLPYFLAAKQIHCIPSSVYLLIDSLPNFPDKPLYLHKYCRPNVTYPTHRKNWIVLE